MSINISYSYFHFCRYSDSKFDYYLSITWEFNEIMTENIKPPN